ncbi:MAG: hypothetical protein MJ094_00815 [Saccharofermentans sp.]|nr:hypothetical protein [Saccharofermentans sp.]
MKFNSKKFLASAVAMSLMLPFTACVNKANEEVLAAADSYATNIVKMKASKIAALTSDPDDDDVAALEDFISNYSNDVYSAIFSTLAYEIDEDSVEASTKNGEGSVDVVFTYVDAQSVFDDVIADGGSEEDFIEALADCDDVVEVELTLNFVLDGEEWLVDDEYFTNVYEVYEFCFIDFEFSPAVTPAMVSDSSRWYYTNTTDVYGLTDEIEYDIIPLDEYQDIEWHFYYEIYFDGGLVYTSDECVDQGYWIEAYYGPNQGATIGPDGYLPSGEYRVVIYAVNGDIVLVDSTCTVGATSNLSTDLISRVEWYYSDEGVYTDNSSIELDIIPTSEGEDVLWEFYYEYYINGELVYTSDPCVDQGHWIEAFYNSSYVDDIEYDSTGLYLAPGFYRCVMYTLDGTVLADETCTVISSTDGGPATGEVTSVEWEASTEGYWYSYSDGVGYAMEEGEYSTSETIIEYTCQVLDEDLLADFSVHYKVFYCANPENATSTDDLELVYAATITPTEYNNGYFYEFQYEGDLQEGVYIFVCGVDDGADPVFLFTTGATVS